jgi:CubicO group peptidase (beta-lactamase class C family)
MSKPIELLSRFVGPTLTERGLPGISVAVTDRDGTVASACFGLADVARGEPVRSETRFEIGSIGKSFTAVALLQLAEEGRLELDRPVQRYLPWFHADDITIDQLLSHTGGLIMGSDVSSASRFDVWSLREQARAEPGRHFHYSNVGFRALGYVLEEIEGRRYPEIIRARILGPLGLDGVDAEITHETRRHLAVGHERWYDDRPSRPGDPLVPAMWLETDTGDGSIAAGAEELAVYLRAFLRCGEPLLRPESFERMLARVVEAGEEEWYGYGIGTRIVDGHERFGHGGSMPGFGSSMFGDLETGVGVVALLNGPDEGDLTKQIATYALALWRAEAEGHELPEPPAYVPRPDYEPVADADAPYGGLYRSYNPWFATFRIGERDGSLVIVYPHGPADPLTPVGEHEFRVGEAEWSPERIRFDALIDGRALRANLSGAEYYRVQ